MNFFFSFLKTLRETGEWASADTWQLVDCNRFVDTEEAEQLLSSVFGSVKCVHGSLPMGIYVAVKHGSALYVGLTGETLMFPQCAFQTASGCVWVFYRLGQSE